MVDLQRWQTYRDDRPTEMTDLQRWKDRDGRPRDDRPTEVERQR